VCVLVCVCVCACERACPQGDMLSPAAMYLLPNSPLQQNTIAYSLLILDFNKPQYALSGRVRATAGASGCNNESAEAYKQLVEKEEVSRSWQDTEDVLLPRGIPLLLVLMAQGVTFILLRGPLGTLARAYATCLRCAYDLQPSLQAPHSGTAKNRRVPC
jgi:hypothetical protein